MKFVTRALLLLTGLLIGILAVGIFDLLTAKPRGEPIRLLSPPTLAPIRVHVAGAVSEPGVYLLPPDSILQDAIEAAGGLLPEATPHSMNLAAPVSDGQFIYLSSPEDEISIPETTFSYTSTPSSKINVNTAETPVLESLPGIGPSLASKIVEYRQQHGPFTCIEDLLNVSGIGPAKLEQIEDFIIVR
jgi:competence protein ComEA